MMIHFKVCRLSMLEYQPRNSTYRQLKMDFVHAKYIRMHNGLKILDEHSLVPNNIDHFLVRKKKNGQRL